MKDKRWVIKIGSSLLTDTDKGLNMELMRSLAAQLAQLHKEEGLRFVLVSSGAVSAGRVILKNKKTSLDNLQAAAAVGQLTLMSRYREVFAEHGLEVAQILLTEYDLARRKSYLNARTTMRRILELGIIPIVNENDTLMDEEVCFGNNDMLAAMTANLLNTDLLVILTDCEGLYDSNPQTNPNAQLIRLVDTSDDSLEQYADGTGDLGRGGMLAKIHAARLVGQTGAATRVVNGMLPDLLPRLFAGEDIGTLFCVKRAPAAARKRWLAGQLRPRGKLHLDTGASQAIISRGVSLLPVGVLRCEGVFERGDTVGCYDNAGKEIARGLINYASRECAQICGKPSGDIMRILGYEYAPEIIHRDNLAIL